MRHVLVTGASGLLGSAVVKCLLASDWKVTAVARSPWQNVQGGLTVIPCDLAKDELDVLPSDAFAVVHCAAYIPNNFSNAAEATTLLQVNGLATLRLLAWAKKAGVSRFINCSSYSLYQQPVPFPIPETHPVYPTGHAVYYATSKLVAEIFATSMDSSDFRVCSLRFSSLYGPAMKESGILKHFATLASKGQDFIVKSHPHSLFDFLYVIDAVQAISLCLIKSPIYTIYNVGAGRGVTLPALALACWEVFGPLKAPLVHFNGSSSEPTHSILDISRAQQDIGYEPSFDLLAGLQEMKQQMV